MRLLPALLVLACTPAVDADADTDTDSDADADVDEGPCPAYTGIRHVGRSRTMGSTPEFEATYGQSTRSTSVITAIDGETVQSETTGWYEVPNIDEYTFAGESEYRCDADGLWLVYNYTEFTIRVGDDTDTSWIETTFVDYLAMPSELGTGWTVDYTSESVASTGGSDVSERSITYTVGESSDVTVPAGTFTAVRIDADLGSFVDESWVDEDVGTVLSSTSQLLEFTD